MDSSNRDKDGVTSHMMMILDGCCLLVVVVGGVGYTVLHYYKYDVIKARKRSVLGRRIYFDINKYH